MIVDFNFSLIGLDKNPIIGSNAGKNIANALASSPKGDSLKLWNWATKLYDGVSLDLDPSDLQTLKSFIENEETFTALLKAQCLEIFNKPVDTSTKEVEGSSAD